MLFSVIIPTKNRIKTLKGTVISLLDQSLDKKFFEIIVMDQSKDSKVKEFIDELEETKTFKIRYIHNNIPGSHSNRNIGVKKAKGDIIIFVDDDIIADKDYLKAIYDSFINDSDIALMTGKILPLYEEDEVPEWVNFFWPDNNWGKYIWEISLLDAGDKYKDISPNLIFGCNFIIRKDIFLRYKGMYPDIFPKGMLKYNGSGETLLAYKIKKDGLKIVYNPAVILNHVVSKERLTPQYFYNRNYIMGIQQSYDDVRKTARKIPLKQVLRDFYLLFKNVLIIIFKFYDKPNRINFICNMYRFKGKMQHKWWVIRDKKLFEYILRDNYLDDGMEFL
ncbi:MAG: glycosyltransferase [Actinobacteria bacterium]|nr:glycosyltransferase [Chloroflexota bacterium]MBE3128171.1 glycosyltransferase [Actinomycetota bacterium]